MNFTKVSCFVFAIFSLFAINAIPSFAQTLSGWPSNSYQKILDVAECGKKLYVDDVSILSADDWVLLIQHRGASMVGEDCSRYGRIEEIGAAGNFELARVESVENNPVSGDDYVVLKSCPTLFYYAAYPGGQGIPADNDYGYQIVKVQYFEGNVEIDGDLVAPQWNSSTGTGGVIAIVARGAITLKADIDASGKGFAGGIPNGTDNNNSDEVDYDYSSAANKSGLKGEGIAFIPSSGDAGRGAAANGGGGGNGKNAGGGGGANFGAGGVGGKQNSAEGDVDNGGVGGYVLNYDEAYRTQVFLGGGGGGGHRSAQTIPSANDSKGGTGGGIVLIVASQLFVDRNGIEGTLIDRLITANGNYGESANNGSNGAGGGGAGGVVLLDVGTIAVNPLEIDLDLSVQAIGGNGGNTNGGADCTGPGGGGGGGVIWFRGESPASGVIMDVSGGNRGQGIGCTPVSHGAEDGQDGIVLEGLSYPVYYDENENPI